MGDSTYMFGGSYVFGRASEKNTSEILKNGRWEEGPTVPDGIDSGCGVAISKTELLLIGGSGTGKRVIKYNVKSNSWDVVASLKVDRSNHRCLVYKNQVFVSSGCCTKSVEVLSLDDMTTRNDSELQLARQNHGMGLIHHEGKLYLTTFGDLQLGDTSEKYSPFELYDEDTKQWTLSKTLRIFPEKYLFGYLTVPSYLICP